MKLGHMTVPGDCERISPVLSQVGNKWSALAVLVLSEEPKRYNQLRREIENISQRMLTVTLRALERDGLVNRQVFSDRTPPQVEYSLTPLGQTLVPPLFALCEWCAHHCDEIEHNQAAYGQEKQKT